MSCITSTKELVKIRTEREKEEKRKNISIQIILIEKKGSRKIVLPNTIRRGVLSRREVLGRLGMIPMIPRETQETTSKTSQERFQIKYTVTAEFIESIDTLYVSEGDKLEIQCEKREIDQFHITEMEKLGFTLTGFQT